MNDCEENLSLILGLNRLKLGERSTVTRGHFFPNFLEENHMASVTVFFSFLFFYNCEGYF